MSYLPKYILKRMFPKKECLRIVKAEGDEFVSITMTNVISPIEVPEGDIDLGGLEIPEKIEEYIKLSINGISVPVTPDVFMNDVSIWYDGKKHTWKSLTEEHSAAGETVPVGGKLSLLIRKSAFPDEIKEALKDGEEVEVVLEANVDQPLKIALKVIVNDKGENFP